MLKHGPENLQLQALHHTICAHSLDDSGPYHSVRVRACESNLAGQSAMRRSAAAKV